MTSRDLIGLVYNARVAEAPGLLKALADSLGLKGRCWLSSAMEVEKEWDKLGSTSLVVVAGGDGTILRTVRVIAPFAIPIVGINMGRVGFMTELRVEEAAEKLPVYLDGDLSAGSRGTPSTGSRGTLSTSSRGTLRVEERMMLQATIAAGSEQEPHLTLHALNDVVIGRGTVAHLMDISASVDGVPLTSYRADAVIVATATGSTGYALSAGGPIIYPEAQVMMVQPVAAHTGMRMGLMLPGDSVIELRAADDHPAMLSVDGFTDATLSPNDRVTVRRSPYTARFLRANPATVFYSALTRRLGLSPRREPP
jgi:NAD+ kinase